MGVEALLRAQLVGVGEQLHGGLARGLAPMTWYSGSSAPIIRLDQSKTRWRSSWGTPISSAMTCRGSSAEICSTKSADPCSHTVSMMASVDATTLASRSRIIRGVKPLLTSRR